jgi:hypothetical protein
MARSTDGRPRFRSSRRLCHAFDSFEGRGCFHAGCLGGCKRAVDERGAHFRKPG